MKGEIQCVANSVARISLASVLHTFNAEYQGNISLALRICSYAGDTLL